MIDLPILDNPLVKYLAIYALVGRIVTYAWIPPEFFHEYPRFQKAWRLTGQIVKYLLGLDLRMIIWGNAIEKRKPTGQTGTFPAVTPPKDKP